jgi:hypothetical protein
MSLTFIVLACHLNVTEPSETNKDCKIFKEEIYQEDNTPEITPMQCMMQSPVMISKFQESHPTWKVHKWSCKYLKQEQDA